MTVRVFPETVPQISRFVFMLKKRSNKVNLLMKTMVTSEAVFLRDFPAPATGGAREQRCKGFNKLAATPKAPPPLPPAICFV